MNNPLGEVIDAGQGKELVLLLLQELEYLRYFYQVADFGPADGDVRAILRAGYKGVIPEGYGGECDESSY